jgi:chemotaxis methyl-accepting protein methylase
VRARLRSRLAANDLESYSEYREFLEGLPKDHPEWESFINLLTTNKTDFFREPKHFDFLVKSILPEFLKGSEKTLKIWSAASSTGEEAYTLAMVLDRHLPKDRDFRILATDIDTNVVKTAQNAVYAIAKKSEIPVDYHQSALDLGRGSAKGWFRIKPHLKEKVIFKQHNLIEQTSPGENMFDLILCRNVLIYFDKETIQFVSKKLFHSTKPNGHLFIGHSESLQGIQHKWQLCGPSVLRKAL